MKNIKNSLSRTKITKIYLNIIKTFDFMFYVIRILSF